MPGNESEGAGPRREQNIKLIKGEFINLEALSHDTGFNILMWAPKDGANTYLG